MKQPDTPTARSVRRDSPAFSVRRGVTAVALAAYAAFVLVVTLSPRMPGTGFVGRLVNGVLDWFHERGLLLPVDYSVVEFTANIGMFVPLGALLLLLRRGWWLLLVGPAFSGFIELFQATFLPTRVGEWRDILSNSLGFLVGAGIVQAADRRLSRAVANSDLDVRRISP